MAYEELEAELLRKVKGIKGNSQYDSWKFGGRRRTNLESWKIICMKCMTQKKKKMGLVIGPYLAVHFLVDLSPLGILRSQIKKMTKSSFHSTL